MLRTRRLVLLPLAERDAESLLEVFNDPEVRRFLLDGATVSLDWVRHEITSSIERFAARSAGLCAIRPIGASAIVGFVGFREFFDPPRLQLLYGLLPAYWGKGLATEAARCMCDFAFSELGFARIEAAMDAPNERSVAVAERLGLRRFAAPGSQPGATVFYEVTREAWEWPLPHSGVTGRGAGPTPQGIEAAPER